MNQARFPYTVYDIINSFGKKNYEQGERYAQEKRVINLQLDCSSEDTFEIQAYVKGEAANPYQSSVTVISKEWKRQFKNRCTCTLGGDCKHVVASLLTLKERGINTFPVAGVDHVLTKPIPHLRLICGDVKIRERPWSALKVTQKILGILSFEYGEGIVPWNQGQSNGLSILRNPDEEGLHVIELISRDWINITRFAHVAEPITFPEAQFILHAGDGTILTLAQELYFKGMPALKEMGWVVEVDSSFPFHPIENIGDWYADLNQTDASLRDWFDLEMGIVVDGQRVNILPLLVKMIRESNNPDALAKLEGDSENGIIYLPLEDGRILPIPAERIQYIVKTLIELHTNHPLTGDGRLRLSTWQAAQLADLEASMQAAQMRWFGNAQVRELGRQLQDFTQIEVIPVPETLETELRPYQAQGLSWLQFLRSHKLNGVLADDMGLGKTVQALAHILCEKESGRMDCPVLVIAPTSLMTNWLNEAQKFAPTLKVLILQGYDRKNNFDRIQDHDVILTTYPLLARDKDILLKHKYHLLILDEAQIVKNPNTMAHRIVQQLQANHRLCLTGTPMENHLGELWSLFHFLMPGFLGDQKQFGKLFRTPIEKFGDDERRQQLVRRVKPFMLRRTKQQVVAELPPKTEIIQSIDLLPKQRDLYESIRLTMHERIKSEIQEKGLNRSQIVILDALLKLRQVCCDPRLLKLEAARNVLESAKLEFLKDFLPEMIEEGRRILIFSQFTSMLALIEEELHVQNISYVKLTGQTKDRATPIDMFQSGEVPLFLISLKAGGTGLNLTAADVVIHVDPWWNPAVEKQATDRAHRIGQDKPVFVYKLITVGTVEEKILSMQHKKAELLDGIFDSERAHDFSLTAEDLNALFEPLET